MDFPHGERLIVESVTVTNLGGGNTSETVKRASWGPCAVWDRYATESTDPRSPSLVVGLSIAGPRRTFTAGDRIVRGGVTYEVDGLPQENTRSPFTGWDPGIVVNVKRAG